MKKDEIWVLPRELALKLGAKWLLLGTGQKHNAEEAMLIRDRATGFPLVWQWQDGVFTEPSS